MALHIVQKLNFMFNSLSDFLFFAKIPSLDMSNPYPRLRSTRMGVSIPDLGLDVDVSKFPNAGKLAGQLRELQKNGVELRTENGMIIGHWHGIRFNIEDICNIITAKEIFIEELYKFKHRKDTVVIDIGMNVGLATLYFSTMENVLQVYGYEPFAFTFEKALKNFEMNPDQKNKISPISVGVSDSTRSIETTFNRMDHTSMGVMGVIKEHHADERFNEHLSIELIDVANVLADVRRRHPGAEILIKMDCEGSEYNIVERLASSDMMREPVHYMIEWHILDDSHDPSRILDLLVKNGFFINQISKTDKIGMIFATRLSLA